MPVITPAYTKNVIRRSIRELIDPGPNKKDVDTIWAYFDSSCAYCGKSLDRADKQGHIDHLLPASEGGANGLSNRVLSCAMCNEKEKLDSDWRQFLELKVDDDTVRAERLGRIEAWIERNGHHALKLSDDLLQRTDAATQRIIDCYEEEVKIIRTYKNTP